MRFLTRFSDYADPSTPYMFHCHLLRHEDEGLMGQFVVVQPGQTPRQPPAHQHQGCSALVAKLLRRCEVGRALGGNAGVGNDIWFPSSARTARRRLEEAT